MLFLSTRHCLYCKETNVAATKQLLHCFISTSAVYHTLHQTRPAKGMITVASAASALLLLLLLQ
jgi:hypothetical protein